MDVGSCVESGGIHGNDNQTDNGFFFKLKIEISHKHHMLYDILYDNDHDGLYHRGN